MKAIVTISKHAVLRYMQRADCKVNFQAAKKSINDLMKSVEAFRQAGNSKSWLSNGWILIQEDNTIVTVYREGETGLPSPKKCSMPRRKKFLKRAKRSRTSDLLQAS